MRDFVKRLAFLTPAFAIAAGNAAGAGGAEPPRALALNVLEQDGSVEIQLIAQSAIAQQVEYAVELVGDSNARHRGNTSISAGDRHVLSRLSTNVTDTWCATVEVIEGSGPRYTLTAGDCSEA
ncbi:hypothetical protein [Qipengyuania sp. ASV99]|uniref:hypothetical protein n=1 Tax=Qipengyuania sp. ASV99 TaxID=3399681 RepID=UPI003A4C596B